MSSKCLAGFTAYGATVCKCFSRKQTVYDETTIECLLVRLLGVNDHNVEAVISPQQPNQQVLSGCLIIDSLPSAEALADSDTMRREILPVMAERGFAILATCNVESPTCLREPEMGNMTPCHSC